MTLEDLEWLVWERTQTILRLYASLRMMPPSEEGERIVRIIRRLEASVTQLRRDVRNHPDHSYDGL